MDGGQNAHGRESVCEAPKTRRNKAKAKWIPAFAGMTDMRNSGLRGKTSGFRPSQVAEETGFRPPSEQPENDLAHHSPRLHLPRMSNTTNPNSNSARLPTLFIPHGGGPCFFAGSAAERSAGVGCDGVPSRRRGVALETKPRAILVISAHWEMPRPTVMTAERPPLLFDYYGFPAHTYRLQYPAPGSPALASRVRAALFAAAGIASDEDDKRGYDHGVFVPFLLMFPDADIPIVQLSLRADLDPAAHLALGRALAPLRAEGVLIVGSGARLSQPAPVLVDRCAGCRSGARVRCVAHGIGRNVRRDRFAMRGLADWANAPGARAAHPRAASISLPAVDGRRGCGRCPIVGGGPTAISVFGKAVSGFRFG